MAAIAETTIKAFAEKHNMLVEHAEIVLKAQAAEQAKAKKSLETVQKYPHALADTLTHDEAAKKNKVKIKCVSCGDTSRWVFTSDLFQVKHCAKCKKEAKAKARKEKAELQKKALAAYEAALKNKKQS